MKIKETFIFSFEFQDRKLRTILTILMVMSGIALLVAVSGIGDILQIHLINNLAI